MKPYDRDSYGDGAQKTGLMLALVDHVTREPIDWPVFPPLGPDEIEWPRGYCEHYGTHQFDLQSPVVETNHPNVTGEAA